MNARSDHAGRNVAVIDSCANEEKRRETINSEDRGHCEEFSVKMFATNATLV